MDFLEEAIRMVDAFVSVDSKRFDLTQTDLNGTCLCYRPGRNVLAVTRTLLPYLIPLAWERHQNLIVRPARPAYGVLAQLDDLDRPRLDRAASRAFLTLETSPGNYQGWVAIDGGDDTLVRRLVKGFGVDWNASRAVRIAGSPNCKHKYEPDFPVVRVVEVAAGRKVRPGDLADLLAPARAAQQGASRFAASAPRGWPDYQRSLQVAPLKGDGSPNRSMADCLWCKWALERGQNPSVVSTKLLEVSEKAKEEWKRGNQAYVRRTVEAASNAN